MDAARALTEMTEMTDSNDVVGLDEVIYLADAPERSLEDAASAAAARNEPLKVRTSLQLWNAEAKPRGQFRGWRGQAWTIPVGDAGGAKQLQQVVEVLFDLIQLGGVEQVLKILTSLKANFAA